MKISKKRGMMKISVILIILSIIFLPIQESLVYAKIQQPIKADIGQQASAVAQSLEQSVLEPPSGLESVIGEDIIINVDQYQPQVISSSLLEDTGVTVFALLSGIPTNPTITIPRILRVEPKVLKIETIPAGKPVSIGLILHKPPRAEELSYNNLGFLVIPIRRVPREQDVPDSIIIDMAARIHFDVSSGLTFGPEEDVLNDQSYEDWLKEKESHSFFAGYIRSSEISDQGAKFVVYDDALNEITTTSSIPPGQKSGVLTTQRRGFSTFGRVFDKFTIRVNEIRSQTDRVRIYIERDGRVEEKKLTRGQSLYSGSSWFVNDIVSKDNEKILELKNRNDQKIVKLILRVTGIKPETSQQQTQALPQNLEINKKYDEIVDKINQLSTSTGEVDYSGIFPLFEALLTDTKITASIAEKAIRQLDNLYRYYSGLQSNVQRLLETARENEKSALQNKNNFYSKKLSDIDSLIKQAELLSGKAEKKIVVKDPINAIESYELAVQSYRELIDRYPNTPIDKKENRKPAIEALYRMGIINWLHLNNVPAAVEAFERLLNEYKTEEIALAGIPPFKIQRDLEHLKRLKTSVNYVEATKTLPDSESNAVTISLIDVERSDPQKRSTAIISVANGPEETIYEGKILESLSTEKRIFRVNKIRDNEVDLVYINEQGATISITLRRNSQTDIQVSDRRGDIKKINLLRTTLSREVHITIEPEPERAFSETTFRIRLGIEKRPFGLPLFSETMDEEIAKTEKLITKLEKILSNAEKLHEYWKKLCFLTYGILWVKNIFRPKTATARTKVNEIYKEKFRNNELNKCEGIKSFEQCIFAHYQDQYEKDIENSVTIVNEIRDGKHDIYFKDLPDNYDDEKRDLYFLNRWHQLHPEDSRIATQYYSSVTSLKRREIEERTTKVFFDGIKQKQYSQVQTQVNEIINNVDVYKNQLVPSGTKSEEQIYNENRDLIFQAYKDRKIREEMSNYYGLLLQNKVPEFKLSPGDETTINSIRELKSFKSAKPIVEIDRRLILKDKDIYYFNLGDTNITIGEQLGKEFEKDGILFRFVDKATEETHKPVLSLVETGRAKGKLEFLSVDALHYVQIAYSSSGRIENTYLFRRAVPNGAMGSEDDVRLGTLDDQLNVQKSLNPVLVGRLDRAKSCISSANRKLTGRQYRRGDTNAVDCYGLGSYSVTSSTKATQSECIDFMGPTDCKVLYNACDPVICPASRCDFGGEWPVENVVETGIIGSSLLCIQNFPEVIFPICLTGIIAGLQNIRSILTGYKDCLIASKIEGRSIGICDKIRSIGICEILWREGIGIFNLKQGIFTKLVGGIFFPEARGGGEYGSFKQSFDNSVENLKYFTQDYAKNTFAQYSGGSLPEIGAEVCKAAIFGKVPGVGNFFDQVIKPESPPQFTAFFDEVPFTDIPDKPFSVYSVFYHIYAGENQDITFSIYLSTEDVSGQQIAGVRPYYIARPRILPRGQYASESIDLQLPSGYKKICVDVRSNVYGQKIECGFGKVSTSALLNYIEDKFVKSEAEKQIKTEEQCIPQQGRITTLSDQDINIQSVSSELGPTSGYIVPRPVVGSFSTGLINTGIIRKCSLINPGIGSNINDWAPVGTCGRDDRGRDLGVCWLYRPGLIRLIDNVKDREELNQSLEGLSRKVITEANVPGINIFNETEIIKRLEEANNLRANKDQGSVREAIKLYQQIINSLFVSDILAAKALFEKGKAYEELASLIVGIPRQTSGSQSAAPESRPVQEQPTSQPSEEQLEISQCLKADFSKTSNRPLPFENKEINLTNTRDLYLFLIKKNPQCDAEKPGTWSLSLLTLDESNNKQFVLSSGSIFDFTKDYISYKININDVKDKIRDKIIIESQNLPAPGSGAQIVRIESEAYKITR